MTTYNTGNALGSTDARDLYDNAKNIDNFANGAANTYADRLGVTRKSLAGINSAFDDFIESSGYTLPVAYTSGIVLSEYNQLIEYDDEFYKLKAGQAPYTTTGTWGADSAKLVAVGDAALRQELTANANDFSLLPEIWNYASLRAYSGPVTAYYVRGVANIFDGGAGVFRVDSDDTTTADNGGTVLVDASGRRWKREFSGAVNVRWFGAVGDGVTDDTAAIQAAINSGSQNIHFPDGTYVTSSTLQINHRPFNVNGNGKIKHLGTSTACIEITALVDAPFSISDISIEGPFASSTYSADSNGIRISGTAARVTTGGRIDNVKIYGFGDNGIRLAYCNGYLISNCHIYRIGRTGLQIRSSKSTVLRGNRIENIFPGAGGIAPYLNAYGITFTQANADTQVCEDCIAEGNLIDGVISWTGIDTHGGQRLIIRGNVVLNTYLGIVLMGPGGGSTANVSANDCEVTENTIRRVSSVAPYSRAGIGVFPSSSGISASAAVRHKISGNYVENHGGLELAEGAITIDNTTNVYCCDNEVVSAIGRGIELGQSSDFPIVGGVIADNVIRNVVGNTISTDPTFLVLTPSSNSTSFSPIVTGNYLVRSSGNGTGIFIGAKPVGAAAEFGPLVYDNHLFGFNESNPLRLGYAPLFWGRLSTNSIQSSAPVFTSEVAADGTLVSGVRGIASVTKLGTGEYRVNFRQTNLLPTSVSEYNVIVSAIGPSVALPTIEKALTHIDVRFYNLAGALRDNAFSMQVSRNLLG